MRKQAPAKSKSKPRAKANAPSRSKFWAGLLLGGSLAASAVHFGPGLLKNLEEDAASETTTDTGGTPKSPAQSAAKTKAPFSPQATPDSGNPPKYSHPETPKPQSPPRPQSQVRNKPPLPPPPVPKPPPAPGLSMFRDPARAANLLTRLGMGESYPGSLLWKKSDTLGWNAFGVIPTSRAASVSTGGPAGNTVTCLLESTRSDRVDALRLIANNFGPRSDEATLAKFKSLAQSVLSETGCPATRQFLEAIDGTKSLQTESTEGRFTLSLSPLAPGTRWELTVQPR